MEKLEQIMHAEEHARKAVETARERAASIVREAKVESQLAVSQAEREAAEETAAVRGRLITEAQEQAERLSQEHAVRMRNEMAKAEERIASTADTIAAELVR